MKNWSKGDVD